MQRFKDDLKSQNNRIKELSQLCQEISDRIDDLSNKKITEPQLSGVNKGLQKIIKECSCLNEKVANIEKTLKEDINIIVVGSVSTGKSKIINAISRRNILLSTSGHTTSCFFRITANQGNYIEYPDNRVEPCSDDVEIERNLTSYTNTLRNNNETKNVVIKVFLNIESPIFQKNVYLTDTPGLGKTDAITDIVAEKCTEMDIMVFVMNHLISKDSQTTIQRLSGVMSEIPTFVLINKWDDTDGDSTEDLDKIKKSIEECFNTRMSCSDQIIGTSAGDAQRKHFYISGKEMDKYKYTEPENEAELKRYREFKLFEQNMASLVRGVPGDKEKRHRSHIEDIKKSFNKYSKDCDKHIVTLRSILNTLKQEFIRLDNSLNTILKDLDTHKGQLNDEIMNLKNINIHSDFNDVKNKMIEMNQPFSKLQDEARRLMKGFIKLVPEKRREIEYYIERLERQKRRITELNTQRKDNYNKSVAAFTMGGLAGAGSIGAWLLSFGAAIVAPVAIVGGLCVAVGCYFYNQGNNKDTQMNSVINDLKRDFDKYANELHDEYAQLKESITSTPIQDDCTTSVSIIDAFLTFLRQNQ